MPHKEIKQYLEKSPGKQSIAFQINSCPLKAQKTIILDFSKEEKPCIQGCTKNDKPNI